MPYRVSIIKDLPEYDALPVAKVTTYPLESRDYRPFAQNILCFGENSLYLRMWAFEVSPAAGSEMRCVLYPFPQKPETALHIKVTAPGGSFSEPLAQAYIIEHGEKIDIAFDSVHPHSGEDLQGIYWGASVVLSLAGLQKISGGIPVAPDFSFPGNFYKTCAESGHEHYGCFFPADFPDAPYSLNSMDAFTLTGY